MRVFKTVRGMQSWSDQVRKKGKVIGLVPTMGYLHEGHLSLVRRARKQGDYVVVSIFVNPLQFGPTEDLARYPRDFARDARSLRKTGVDVIFFPSVEEMYPGRPLTYVEVPELSKPLCGRSRPFHFRGVCTVVAKLFNTVKPHLAVFGRKDFQQAAVIKQMVVDLDLNIKIVVAPTVRERDGLAMSSRNKYLSRVERERAPVLYAALRTARHLTRRGVRSPRAVIGWMQGMIERAGGRIDYISIVDEKTLKAVRAARKGDVVALAVFFGKTRLIDNIRL
jgi:pantoate--beta-alanine ligase